MMTIAQSAPMTQAIIAAASGSAAIVSECPTEGAISLTADTAGPCATSPPPRSLCTTALIAATTSRAASSPVSARTRRAVREGRRERDALITLAV